jgi:arginyl-tRNA synthetase
MVFAVARQAGWLEPPLSAEHVAFGSVLGPDKKMFKTRGGETVRLADLLDEACERALAAIEARFPELDAETKATVSRQVGIGAIKYADLSSDRIKDYIFDWNRMVAFEGNTGGYVQYAHARIRSIQRKGGEAASLEGPFAISHSAEHALALAIVGFGSAVQAVADTLEPHRLTGYLYELAKAYSTFYDECPVIKAETPELRRSRLALSELTARVLAKGLELLGIEAPARM